jgi:hypothetical protein
MQHHLEKAMEGKYFFRYRKKKMTMTSFTLFPPPTPRHPCFPMHFSLGLSEVRKGMNVYTRIHKAVQRKLRMKEMEKKVKEISK